MLKLVGRDLAHQERCCLSAKGTWCDTAPPCWELQSSARPQNGLHQHSQTLPALQCPCTAAPSAVRGAAGTPPCPTPSSGTAGRRRRLAASRLLPATAGPVLGHGHQSTSRMLPASLPCPQDGLPRLGRPEERFAAVSEVESCWRRNSIIQRGGSEKMQAGICLLPWDSPAGKLCEFVPSRGYRCVLDTVGMGFYSSN